MAGTTKKKKEKIDIRQINFGNVQPQALDMEAGIIGTMMINKDAVSVISSSLMPEYFYDTRNEKIYTAIMQLFSSKMPIDSITVINQLKQNGELEDAGGVEYIAELTNNVSSVSHLEYYAKIVTQKYLARELIRIAVETQSRAFDEKTDVEDLIQDTQGQVFQISKQNIKQDVQQIDPVINEAIERIREASKQKEGLSGVSSGFPEVDRVTFGWQKSDLIIIAARPAMGKTAFVLSMIKNIAVDGVRSSNGTIERIPCAMFSLEMSMVQLVNRLIINVCRIPGDKIKSGQLTHEEWMRLDAGRNALQGAPIYLDETPQLSVLEFRTKAMRLVADHGIKIIFIDYLQLMNAQGMNFFSREGEVSLISRSLKGLAKELKIPIIALSQLNRNTEKRDAANAIDGRKPQLADLRESGAIEQDADIVAFIHRPEYYKIYQDTDGTDLRGVAQLLIAKHRNGSTEDINLRFRKEYAQFLSNSDNEMPPMPDVNDMIIGSRTNTDQYSNYDEMLSNGGNNDLGF
ncbi:MAG: replicative DNA helicase [Paludibacteraceae bacterium]|nr:replicative DNA helicase [Paludibacteraceae bacterium]